MLSLFDGAPPRLIVCALSVGVLTAVLAAQLSQQAARRLFGVPHVPRARVTYAALATLWVGLAASLGAALVTAFLLRDHQRVEGRTPLADLRCETIEPGRLRAELTTPRSSTPERYDIVGDECVLSMVDVDLRPGLRFLGVSELSRIAGVGSVRRPSANPAWLTPDPQQGRRLLGLLVRDTHGVSVAVPAGSE
jgi:hypothetical protein